MKQFILFISMVLFACGILAQDPNYPASPPAPQNIIKAEYFFDADPGFGNGTNIPITPGTDIANALVSINTTGLSNGVHRLLIRTLNNEGHWALTTPGEFIVDADPAYAAILPAPQNITGAEYFFDNDPGIGNGIAISITPGVDLNNLAVPINTTGLSNGIHRLFLRTRSNEGHWSIINYGLFAVDFDPAYPAVPATPQNIIQAEYFINTDPGIGNGTPITITPGVDIANYVAAINTSALTAGTTNQLFIRTKNNEGHWSISNYRIFVVDIVSDPVYPTVPAAPQNIIQAEYFINTDPGVGNGTPISITPGVDIANTVAAINTSALTAGTTNQVFIRTKNNEGHWSISNYRSFIVDIVSDPLYPASPAAPQNILQAEYFLNTDPGIGNGTPITIAPGVDIANIAASINTSGLSAGSTNQLFVRTKNNEGHWSISNYRTVIVDLVGDPVYPTVPAAPQNILRAEYFVDTDPGIGNAVPITVTPGVDISNISVAVNTNGLPVGVHQLVVRSYNAEGNWSISNVRTFNIGTISILPDSIVFPVTVINTTDTRSLVIRNNSSTAQTVTAVTVAAPFTTNFTTTRTINPGLTDTIRISFTPTAAVLYQDVISLQTSAGAYSIPVKGTGIAVISSWVLEPAAGYNYGNVQTGTSSNFNFTIRNTGNAAITLNEASSSHPAFVPTFTAGTVVPVNGSINLPVAFNPTAVTAYNAVLKIKATAGGPDSVTTSLSGNGFTPATPPVLSFVTNAPYDGVRGVNPAAGQTGTYTYKIVYRSADNRAPANGQPQIGIDLTGDQDFDDGGEGIFAMTKEGSSTDYVTGVVYSYTVNYNSYSNTMGYRFFAQDVLGNAAVTSNTAYYSGPIVTFQTLDLRLFANDISFSKNNPLPGESFTVTANIHNNSAFTAANVPVYFYRDTILIGSTTVAVVNPYSTATVTRTLSFAADGFYPIKVWIDPNKTLNESNVLNNYAIRPIIVGTPVLPGGITVTGTATVQTCPALRLIFSGNAQYYGTAIPTSVAGAEVTINTGTAILKTTTDASGNYYLAVENPPCGNTITYTVSVTDFTFTSNTFTGAVSVNCPAPNACGAPPVNGGAAIAITSSTQPCNLIVGNTVSTQITITYRGRNISNFWSSWDRIWKDTVKIFNNGVLIQTYYTDDIPDFGSAGTFPGDVKVFPVTVPITSAGPNNITAIATYQYNEFFQIPSSLYKGVFTNMTATAGTTVVGEANLPDLTIDNFRQTAYRSFSFNDRNLKCGTAGSHVVRMVDVTNPGAPVLLYETTVSSLGPQNSTSINVSLPTLSIGTHVIRIVTDTTGLVTETNELNNLFETTITVPQPDLTVGKITVSASNVAAGGAVTFKAVIKNSGTATGPFTVSFLANGLPIGSSIAVAGIGEKGETIVTSNVLNVLTADTDCAMDITVVADDGAAISESNESNNTEVFKFGTDVQPLLLPVEFGSASNPVRIRVNTAKQYNAYIRNTGSRDLRNVTVKFMYNGNKIGDALIPVIKAGMDFPAVASFNYTFTTVGPAVVTVISDTANVACEIDETNNTGDFNVVVTDSKEDYVVLSQFISPSSLNPNAGQSITIVGTVKNIGNKIAPASNMRFYVDNIKLGADVPFNTLQIGQDTTIAATVPYSSTIPGVKVVKITVDEDGLIAEEDENNNAATRIIIVGDAPDMTRNALQPIGFNPSGFNAGDSVTVSYQIRNAGSNTGTAWARLKIFDAMGTLTAIDSVQFTLVSNANTTISKRMFFAVDSGTVVAEIVNCSPLESNLLNNSDTLPFSIVAKMKASLSVTNLDMKAGAPQQLPGWIGGKIMLGDYDLTVNGTIVNFDTAHFIITNGTGRLKIVNSNPENIFPVGPSLYQSNFARINNAGTADHFSMRVVPYVLQNGTSGNNITSGYVNRTWFIDEDVPGGSNATVELFWFVADEQSAFGRGISRVAHFTGSWELGTAGAALQDSIGRYSRLHSGYTNFSPFSVTSNSAGLPLRFLSFTAAPVQNDVILNWTTDNEINTSHFDVEWSKDGIRFEKADAVRANNTSGVQRYSFTHRSPSGNILFYRIKQVDLDGKFEYSQTVQINRNTVASVVLLQNPVTDKAVLLFNKPAQKTTARLFNSNGQLVKQELIGEGTRQYSLSLHQLAAGVYTLHLQSPQGVVSFRLVKTSE